RATKAGQLARAEAVQLRHNYLGTEHLLLGMMREGQSQAAALLHRHGVDAEKVQHAVEAAVGRGDKVVIGDLGVTLRLQRVMESALDEAKRLGHTYVGTEHMLLGLIDETEGLAARILRDLGVDLRQLREEVLDALSASPTE
ncbi:MAG: NDP-hexose 4-ketoreductase, partial [Chloroflexi bacterium]|nr:NDP-hexose 4-ketoreductase [Chloroflexota bacterium]